MAPVTRTLLALAFVAVIAAGGCATPSAGSPSSTEPARPAGWAQPVTLDGVPNLHRVSPGLYRSAQPTTAGMRRLGEFGIRTVINLRAFHSDRSELDGTELRGIRIPTHAWAPTRAAARRFLDVVTDPDQQPVLVHCQHGADRTGAMVALYRIAVEGWSRDAALAEMTDGGFGYHSIWTNLPPWVRSFPLEDGVD